ncbi:MAG: succinate dehydrogenase/fumarate reductase iron-sulfur subunit [Planctomycetota bacterium]|nr:succinate dehydrogenase/fumarate reductase iron-sulfur subunit [Planctomycetota bacterium]
MAASETGQSGPTIPLDVFRYQPDQGDETTFQRYQVPYKEDWVVLDALNYIKDRIDGTLSYRWSCRMGVCGSCGMMVNSEPKLTCAAFLRDYYPNPIRVEPLSYFPVIRDLVINMDDFLDKLDAVKAWLVPEEEKPLSEGEYRQTPAQLAYYKQFSMCINCMLCYAACPVYGEHSEFIGPAAIALAQRYNLDSRDGAAAERAEVIFSHEGIWACTFVGDCTRVCPKNVDPAGAIQQAKVTATKDWFRSVLMPWGKK